jgi:hypothetical protein
VEMRSVKSWRWEVAGPSFWKRSRELPSLKGQGSQTPQACEL